MLRVQLDNTTKENKNNYMLGYLAMLVQTAVFTVVELHFLPVGHTHNDLDGVFGRCVLYMHCCD
jgi:hypothetical protein